tara:strand:+ start:342 stop:1238 length:897 start_codon:yes stop_codon:yes gene_type:complete
LKTSLVFSAIRPSHWVKNFLVFLAPLLTFQLNFLAWKAAAIAFIVFCLISSSIYLFNDVIDYKLDKKHHKKKFRAVASGKLKRSTALFVSFLFFLLSITLSYKINIFLLSIVFFYYVIQILYCLSFKNKPILDLFCISSGFLLRSIAGGVAGGIFISTWFILTIGLLSCFLALEKRKAELRNYENTGILTRKVLKKYSIPFLLRLENTVSSSAFITYSLWASGPSLNGASTNWMLLTVPLVLLGISRYQLISDPSYKKYLGNEKIDCENPVNIFIQDRGMKLILIFWILFVFLISILS